MLCPIALNESRSREGRVKCEEQQSLKEKALPKVKMEQVAESHSLPLLESETRKFLLPFKWFLLLLIVPLQHN